ncbi:MAG: hypothetical protein U0R49_00100 [Fimbriimonadales bacterium]
MTKSKILFAVAASVLALGAVAIVVKWPTVSTNLSDAAKGETTEPSIDQPNNSPKTDVVSSERNDSTSRRALTNDERQNKTTMTELLNKYSAEVSSEAPEFAPSHTVSERKVNEMPSFWAEVNPGVAFKPETVVSLGQELRLKNSDDPRKTRILLSLRLHEQAALARLNGMYWAFGQAELPPKTVIPSGTPSGIPLGEACWSSSPVAAPEGHITTCRITAYDGLASVRLDLSYQPRDATARQLVFDPITQDDIRLAERLARMTLATGIKAILQFDRIEEVQTIVKRDSVKTRTTADAIQFVSLSSISRLIGARVTDEGGIWSFTYEGRKFLLALGSRSCLVDGQAVKLDAPILHSGGTAWVDGKTILKLLGLRS